MKKVQGFQTNDGRFFELAEDAELHEAALALTQALVRTGIKQENVMGVMRILRACQTDIVRYLNAVSQVDVTEDEPKEQDNGQAVEDADDAGEGVFGGGEGDDNLGDEDDTGTEEEAEDIQQLPPGVHEPMPDVGRYIQPTKVRVQRPVNGPRGGKPNARERVRPR